MSTTIQEIFDLVNDHIMDSSEDRVSNLKRFRKITEAVNWIQEELENDHQVKSVDFQYFDTVNTYKIKQEIAFLLDTNKLKLPLGSDYPQFTKRPADDLSAAISSGSPERGYAIEWKNGEPTLLINFKPKRRALVIGSMDNLTIDGGEWQTGGDAENIRVDNIEFYQGTGSIVFDIDNSVNEATLFNEGLVGRDISLYEGISTWLVDVKIPFIQDLTSIVFRWGSSDSDYYEVETSSDMFGADFSSGQKMTLAFDWDNPTVTGTPNPKESNFAEIVFNGLISQSGVRVDNLRLVIPQELELKYLSYVVGTNSSGDDIISFSDLTDIPYFSEQYDQLKYPVAHKASSLIFADLRLYDDQINHENKATERLRKIAHIIPRSREKEVKQFRPSGLNFRSISRGRRF